MGELIDDWWALFPERSDRRRVAQGRAFQRSGRVTNVRVTPGRLSGNVQGSRATPYLVEVLLPPLGDDSWTIVVDLVSAQLRFSAQLLAGQLPVALAAELADRGVELLGRRDQVDPRCACGYAADGCAHLAALWEAAGHRFAADPFELLRLRGRGRESLLSQLAAHRRRLRGSADTGVIPLAALEAADWEAQGEPGGVRVPPPAPPVAPAAPLRLLGNPPGWAGGVSAVDLFSPLVVGAAEEAERVGRSGESPDR